MEIQTSYNMLENNNKFNDYFEHHYALSKVDTFDKKQMIDLVNSSLIILKDYISKSPLCFINPSIEKDLEQHLYKFLELQTNHLYVKDPLMTQVNANNHAHNKLIDTDLRSIVKLVFALFYKFISPKRSYSNTFLRKAPNIPLIYSKITYLQNLKQPDQRTPEWYVFRHNTLTASNIYKTFMSEANRNQLIYEKCEPINPDKFRHTSMNSPLHWGQKFEPLSVMYYESEYKTKVGDFGCIQHKEFSFIAASPDGINVCEKSPIYGRMLEIKNVVSRVINGNPKLEYWVQMQMQMEACDLNECDFLETKFVEYEDEDEFDKDTNTNTNMNTNTNTNTNNSFNLSASGKMKGIMLLFMKDGTPYYEYAPLNISKEEFQVWEAEVMEENASLTWIKNIYWRLEKISCVLVLRNKSWFNSALPYIRQIWNIILEERKGDYQHRAPKKRQKINTQGMQETKTKVIKVIKVIKENIDIDMSHIG